MSKAQLKDVSQATQATQATQTAPEVKPSVMNSIINTITGAVKKDIKVDLSKSYKGISNIDIVKDCGKVAANVAGHVEDKAHLVELCKVLHSRGVVIGQLNKKADSIGYQEALIFKTAFTETRPNIKVTVLNNYMSEVRKAVASGKDFSFNSAQGAKPKTATKQRTVEAKTLDDFLMKAFTCNQKEGMLTPFELLCNDLEKMFEEAQVKSIHEGFVWYLQSCGHELPEFDTVVLDFDVASKVGE